MSADINKQYLEGGMTFDNSESKDVFDAWEEQKHPRGKGGQFAKKGEGATVSWKEFSDEFAKKHQNIDLDPLVPYLAGLFKVSDDKIKEILIGTKGVWKNQDDLNDKIRAALGAKKGEGSAFKVGDVLTDKNGNEYKVLTGKRDDGSIQVRQLNGEHKDWLLTVKKEQIGSLSVKGGEGDADRPYMKWAKMENVKDDDGKKFSDYYKVGDKTDGGCTVFPKGDWVIDKRERQQMMYIAQKTLGLDKELKFFKLKDKDGNECISAKVVSGENDEVAKAVKEIDYELRAMGLNTDFGKSATFNKYASAFVKKYGKKAAQAWRDAMNDKLDKSGRTIVSKNDKTDVHDDAEFERKHPRNGGKFAKKGEVSVGGNQYAEEFRNMPSEELTVAEKNLEKVIAGTYVFSIPGKKKATDKEMAVAKSKLEAIKREKARRIDEINKTDLFFTIKKGEGAKAKESGLNDKNVSVGETLYLPKDNPFTPKEIRGKSGKVLKIHRDGWADMDFGDNGKHKVALSYMFKTQKSMFPGVGERMANEKKLFSKAIDFFGKTEDPRESMWNFAALDLFKKDKYNERLFDIYASGELKTDATRAAFFAAKKGIDPTNVKPTKLEKEMGSLYREYIQLGMKNGTTKGLTKEEKSRYDEVRKEYDAKFEKWAKTVE